MRLINAIVPHRRALLAALLVLAGCATVPPPRTDDPLQNFNRKMYSFNRTADRVAIRPVATAYRKVTTPGAREHINDFFSNVRLPITIVNELLQAHPVDALKSTGRLAVNTTLGLLGFFDPASRMNLPLDETDFGVTLAHWGVPEGPFVVIPLVGPTTARDIWRLPVDSYFDPLSWYSREHDLKLHAQYLPSLAYLITLRSRGLDAENFLNSAYDPYIFERDAYRQKRIYEIYHGDPPASVIERFQGVGDNGDDIDQLLEEQHAYEKSQGQGSNTEPAGGSSSGPPPDSNSPASASSA